MMSRTKVAVGSGVVVLAGLVAMSLTQIPPAQAEALVPAAQRQEMPNFTLKDLDGKSWTLADHKGKVVMVNFWATWCPPCRRETPGLVKVANDYAPKGLDSVGISLDQPGDDAVVKQFAAAQKIPYPILRPGENSPVTKDITAIPVTVLLDRQGKVAKKYVGAVPEDELSQQVAALVAEK